MARLRFLFGLLFFVVVGVVLGIAVIGYLGIFGPIRGKDIDPGGQAIGGLSGHDQEGELDEEDLSRRGMDNEEINGGAMYEYDKDYARRRERADCSYR